MYVCVEIMRQKKETIPFRSFFLFNTRKGIIVTIRGAYEERLCSKKVRCLRLK